MVKPDRLPGTDDPATEAETAIIIPNGRSKSATQQKEPKSSVLPEILACVSANSFHVGLGLTLAYSAVLLPQIEHADSDLKVNATTESPWIASASPLAVTTGSLLTGPVSNFLGRITSVRVAAIPYCIGWGVIATAKGVPALIFGRFLSGLAAGTIGTNPAIVYTTEVARPAWRGALISTAPFMVSAGTMIVYVLGAFLPWRAVAWVCFCAPLLPLISTLLWAPESPHWLADKGKKTRLIKAVKFLARKNQHIDPVQKSNDLLEEVEKRKAEQKSRHKSKNICTNFFKIAGQKTVFRPLLLLAGLFFVMQFSGIYVVQFYAVSIFEKIGSALDPHYATIVVGALRTSMSVVAIVLLRCFPRRPLIIFSAAGVSFWMGLAGYFADVTDSGKIPLDTLHGALATSTILLFVLFSMIGLLTIPWTMTAELFPAEARSYAQGIVIAMANSFMFASVQSFRPLEASFGGVARVMWLYSGVASLGIIIVVLFIPETHKRSLAEIEAYFGSSWFYPGYERRLRLEAEEGPLSPAIQGEKRYEAVSPTEPQTSNRKNVW